MGANTSSPERVANTPSKGEGGAHSTRHSRLYIPGDVPSTEGVVLREKKKKASKFATLRKKLARARRHSRSMDYGKAMREMASSWNFQEISGLVDEYEATISLKELAILSNLARPHGNTVKEDLAALYECKFCTDVDLIFDRACFPVHRAILSVRCPFFRDLLSKYPEYGAQVPVDIRTQGVDASIFSLLLRYLYTGDWLHVDSKVIKYDMLLKLSHEFGTPNPLDQDLRTLLDSNEYSDSVISFSAGQAPTESPSAMGAAAADNSAEGSCVQLHCHKAILAARSPFFRNMLLRRARSGEELTERALHSPTCIVLDESVIPKQYARILVHALYLDTVDLSSILQGSVSTSSLCEVQAMVAGKGHTTQADEAMEIYQIGQFLEFPRLSQGCEDIIVEQLTTDKLVSVLQWSSEPYGSLWVNRQALHFLREEFLSIAQLPVLFDLSKEQLIEALQSDFLQAGELDILNGVIKWGEHLLIKRLEEREPNLLTHTAHSISKKGVKKRDLNDNELREILHDILAYVRVEHVIPSNSDVLTTAIKRGLVNTPPPHMIDEPNRTRSNPWIHSKQSSLYSKPRLFLPYYEEAKALLEDHMAQSQEHESVRLRLVHLSSVPDTLYMVDDRSYGSIRSSHSQASMLSACSVDIIAVPDQLTLKHMVQRQQELQQSVTAHRAYSLPCSNKASVTYQIQLRVVREFGLPDSTVEVLQGASVYQTEENPMLLAEAMYNTPRRHKAAAEVKSGSPHTLSPTTPTCSPTEKEPSTCSDSMLSDVMPDIAMATATSSMQQMNIHEHEPPQQHVTTHQVASERSPDLGIGEGCSVFYDTKTMYI